MKVKTITSAEIGRPKHRRKNPIQAGVLYQFRQPQYDFYGVTPATILNRQTLFMIPVGQQYTPNGGAAFTKTAWHTTMVQAGLFPNPDKFYAKHISVSLRSDVYIEDAIRFLADSLVIFNISQRPFMQIHAFKAPQAGGPYGLTEGLITNGVPDTDNEFAFSDALGEIVEQGQNFNVVIDPTQVVDADGNGVYTAQTDQQEGGGTGINCFVYLDGLYSRVVL